MKRMSQRLRDWLAAVMAVPCPPDPLESLDNRTRADLPPLHPFPDCRA